MTRTMSFRKVGSTMLLVHGRVPPTMDEWMVYVAAVAEAMRTDPVKGLLVWSAGAGPNASMRRAIIEAYGNPAPPVAVCSASPVARGITTAISWLYPSSMRSFLPTDVEAAMDWLNVPAQERGDVRMALDELRHAIGVDVPAKSRA